MGVMSDSTAVPRRTPGGSGSHRRPRLAGRRSLPAAGAARTPARHTRPPGGRREAGRLRRAADRLRQAADRLRRATGRRPGTARRPGLIVAAAGFAITTLFGEVTF